MSRIKRKRKEANTKEEAIKASLEEREARKKYPAYRFFGINPFEAVKGAFDRGGRIENVNSQDLKEHEDERVRDIVFDCENCGAVISKVGFIDCTNMIQGNDFNLILCDDCRNKIWDEVEQYVSERKRMSRDELKGMGLLHDYQ